MSAVKTSTLLAITFNSLAALCNHWSDKSSFFFIASMKVAGSVVLYYPAQLFQVSRSPFSFGFLVPSKALFYVHNFLWLTAYFYIWRFFLLYYTAISVEICSFSFVCCFNILFNFTSFVKSRRHWGWHFTVSFSTKSAVIIFQLSRMRWKFWKLDGSFSTAVHFWHIPWES